MSDGHHGVPPLCLDELQGLMGRKYAALQGEHDSVCAAIEEHYKPLGPSDRVPSDPVSIAVALADKLDTLVGFWAIDEKPTGSKDPFALRRAALGVIRLILDRGLRLELLVLPLPSATPLPRRERLLDLQLPLLGRLRCRCLARPDLDTRLLLWQLINEFR